MMEISVTFLLAGCLIQGVLCGFSISLPERVEALEGSCVFIPCTFDINQTFNADLTDSAKRLWYKEGISKADHVVFDYSSPDSGLLTGEIFGKPTEKNCSTRFNNLKLTDSGSYYFRLEGSGRLQYSYRKPLLPHVEIVIKASPPNPTVLLLQDQQEEMEVTEGKSVTLSCSIKIFCTFHPPSLTWSSTLQHLNITEQPQQNDTHLSSDLMFTVTHHHHRAEFTCTATQQQITTHSTRQLHVQYAPKNTSVHIYGAAVEGHSVTLSCSSEANPAVKYSWYRHTEGDLKPVQTRPNLTETNLTLSYSNLTISDINPSHSGRYYCRAINQHGTQNTSVLLDVQYAPKSVSAHVSPAGVIVEGHSVTLSCSSEANPAVKYSWYRHTEGDLELLQTEPNLTINNTNLNETNLTISTVNLAHSGRYYCRAENQHGTQSTSVLLDIQSLISGWTNFCLLPSDD